MAFTFTNTDKREFMAKLALNLSDNPYLRAALLGAGGGAVAGPLIEAVRGSGEGERGYSNPWSDAALGALTGGVMAPAALYLARNGKDIGSRIFGGGPGSSGGGGAPGGVDATSAANTSSLRRDFARFGGVGIPAWFITDRAMNAHEVLKGVLEGLKDPDFRVPQKFLPRDPKKKMQDLGDVIKNHKYDPDKSGDFIEKVRRAISDKSMSNKDMAFNINQEMGGPSFTRRFNRLFRPAHVINNAVNYGSKDTLPEVQNMARAMGRIIRPKALGVGAGIGGLSLLSKYLLGI